MPAQPGVHVEPSSTGTLLAFLVRYRAHVPTVGIDERGVFVASMVVNGARVSLALTFVTSLVAPGQVEPVDERVLTMALESSAALTLQRAGIEVPA